ncbi:hypothetical protein D3C84_839040 [compost metagenome]
MIGDLVEQKLLVLIAMPGAVAMDENVGFSGVRSGEWRGLKLKRVRHGFSLSTVMPFRGLLSDLFVWVLGERVR